MTFEVVQGDRGPLVSSILSVEPPAAGPGPVDRGLSFDTRYPGPRADALPPADMALPGTVKFYDPARDFGFVVPDRGGAEGVRPCQCAVLLRHDRPAAGATCLRPRGLQATDIEPL